MKKSIILLFFLVSYIFPKDVSPVISIRYDNLDGAVEVTDAIGLKFNLQNNRYTGFDTDGEDHRIYVGWGFGKIGLGHNGNDAEYTVGANYEVFDNIGLDLDYVMGNTTNNLRLGININF